MPEISRFLGIVIYINYNDHSPPHFHTRYNEFRAVFSVESLEIIEGNLPNKVTSIILEWAFMHRKELSQDWELARLKQPLRAIEPLV